MGLLVYIQQCSDMEKVSITADDGNQIRIKKVILYGTFEDTVKREDIVLIHNENAENHSTNKILGILRKSTKKNELFNSLRCRHDITY
jgi:hypothetical protein